MLRCIRTGVTALIVLLRVPFLVDRMVPSSDSFPETPNQFLADGFPSSLVDDVPSHDVPVWAWSPATSHDRPHITYAVKDACMDFGCEWVSSRHTTIHMCKCPSGHEEKYFKHTVGAVCMQVGCDWVWLDNSEVHLCECSGVHTCRLSDGPSAQEEKVPSSDSSPGIPAANNTVALLPAVVPVDDDSFPPPDADDFPAQTGRQESPGSLLWRCICGFSSVLFVMRAQEILVDEILGRMFDIRPFGLLNDLCVDVCMYVLRLVVARAVNREGDTSPAA